VFAGNTDGPTEFTQSFTEVKDTFGLTQMLLVGERGMITIARIRALTAVGGLGRVTALGAAADRRPGYRHRAAAGRADRLSHTPPVGLDSGQTTPERAISGVNASAVPGWRPNTPSSFPPTKMCLGTPPPPARCVDDGWFGGD